MLGAYRSSNARHLGDNRMLSGHRSTIFSLGLAVTLCLASSAALGAKAGSKADNSAYEPASDLYVPQSSVVCSSGFLKSVIAKVVAFLPGPFSNVKLHFEGYPMAAPFVIPLSGL